MRPRHPNSGAASKNYSSSSAELTPRDNAVGNIDSTYIMPSFKKGLAVELLWINPFLLQKSSEFCDFAIHQ